MDEFTYIIAVTVPGIVCVLTLAKALQIAYDEGTQGSFEVISSSPCIATILFCRSTRDVDTEYLLRRMRETGCTVEEAAIAQLKAELTEASGEGLQELKESLNSSNAKCLTFGNNALSSIESKRQVKRLEIDQGALLLEALAGDINLAEVSTWVGLHHRVNFDTEGNSKRSWVIRFLEAHQDDPRFSAYLVCDCWSHILWGTEVTTRWVYQLWGGETGLISAQIRGPWGWLQIRGAQLHDLADSVINANEIPATWNTDFRETVSLLTELPDWAQHP